jgi:SAM-dependent MidA family methyltransferase
MAASRQSAVPAPLSELLIRHIRARGPMPFADYMRECLYHPWHGYYSRAEAKRFADYYTSVDVHPIFGRLLARQLAEMWRVLAKPQPFYVAEAGAGSGRLARNILDFAARELPDFYEALNYLAVERSAARRAMQENILAAHFVAGRCQSAAEIPHEIPAGCILSNEFVDALPVHRVVSRNGALQEILVGVDGESLCELRGPLSTGAIPEYFAAQGITLGDGQQAEASLEACDWILEAGRRLERGFILTIDYGHEAPELYSERHFRGTLLAYREHRVSEDFLAAPGEQDLTAHANFTALEEWGKRAGLVRTGLVSQSRFLMALGKGNQFADLYGEDHDEGDDRGVSEIEKIRGRLLLKTLIFPEGMGETFKVLVQHKGLAEPELTGLGPF